MIRLARAEMSSYPCPANCASQDNCSVIPKNLNLFVTRRSEESGGAGHFLRPLRVSAQRGLYSVLAVTTPGPALHSRHACGDACPVLCRQLLAAPGRSCTLDAAVVVRAGAVGRLSQE